MVFKQKKNCHKRFFDTQTVVGKKSIVLRSPGFVRKRNGKKSIVFNRMLAHSFVLFHNSNPYYIVSYDSFGRRIDTMWFFTAMVFNQSITQSIVSNRRWVNNGGGEDKGRGHSAVSRKLKQCGQGSRADQRTQRLRGKAWLYVALCEMSSAAKAVGKSPISHLNCVSKSQFAF